MKNDFWAFSPLKIGFFVFIGQIDVYLRSSPVEFWIFKTLSQGLRGKK